jgi:ethanolamine ammonia-lyase large subunit
MLAAAMKLAATLLGQRYTFSDVKEVLAKANERKSGDELAGVAARDPKERAAAKIVLAGLTLAELRENPVVPYEEDEVTRNAEDSIPDELFAKVASFTVSDLREWLLDTATTGEAMLALSPALSPEMIAACAKLMSNLDLVLAAKKIHVPTVANATFGLPGRISFRLQPNHPTDDAAAIHAAIREGLVYGSGDAVIGINPATDSVESTCELLAMVKELLTCWRCPTQNCLLSHVTIQMEALRRRAPMDLMFQSLSGTERGCRAFGVHIALLDEAAQMVAELGTARGPNRMYFETGQGSALSSNAHHGADQQTLEVRNYTLARRWKPFLVNTVVGFIGPEYLYDGPQIARAGLEDVFSGKLAGLPMGCDVCYTNHARCDQNELETLAVLLAAAGCAYFMGLPLGDDIMLNYQSTSFHDNATVRQIFGYRPTPEFEAWMESLGLLEDGRPTARFGDPTVLP